MAIAAGLVMTAAIGVRRSGSAWARFARTTRSPDLFTDVPVAQAQSSLEDLLTKPGVEHAALMTYILVSPAGRIPAGEREPGGFVGLSDDFGTSVYRPRILRGRAADPQHPGEITINEAMATMTGLGPGDTVVLESTPPAVEQAATVVGIEAGPLDVTLNTDSPGALFTPAFGARWFATYLRHLSADDRDHYTAVLMAAVTDPSTRATLLSSGFVPGVEFGSEAITGLRAERNGFLVLTIVGGVGALLAIGQALSRRTRRDAGQLATLGAVGLAPRQRRLAIAATPWSAAVVGLLIAPLVTVATTPWITIGLNRRLDPTRPHVADLTVMLLGPVVGAIVTAAVAFSAATRADRRRGASAATGVSLHLPGAAGLLGSRVLGGWGTANGRALARSHIIGGIVAVAAITGVAVWSGASRHLSATPASYGVTWDVSVRATYAASESSVLDRVQRTVSGDPRVGTTMARVVAGMPTESQDQLEIVAIDDHRSTWWPTVIAGRRPVADDEVTVGPAIPDANIGDTMTLRGSTYRIVGTHVVAPLKNGSPGGTVAMTTAAATGVEMNPKDEVLLIRLAPGATVDDLRAIVGPGVSLTTAAQSRSGDINNLARTVGLIEVLLFACAALGFAAFVNGLLIASRSRTNDYTTMSALGARRRTIVASIGWHAFVAVAIGSVLGIPAGVIVGRTVWRRTADGLNAVPDLWRWPVDALAVGAGSIVAVALAVAITASSVRDRLDSRDQE